MEGGTMNICLRVLKETNKSRYGTYSVKGMPLHENVYTSKQYLLENCTGEIAPAIPHIIGDPACWGVIFDKERYHNLVGGPTERPLKSSFRKKEERYCLQTL